MQSADETITAVIITHPARMTNGKLERALRSVMRQTRQPDAVVVTNDRHRRGAGANRQNALNMITTDWMAWLDSDDEWHPDHLEKLHAHAQTTGAMFVFSWFDQNGGDPFGYLGRPFNPQFPHHTTITFMVRTVYAQQVGFNVPPPTRIPQGQSGEDWPHVKGICQIALEQGLVMSHLPERTWTWHRDGGNTSGCPGQGDAA